MEKLLYIVSVTVGSGVLGFLALLAIGLVVGHNESWEGLALQWVFVGGPVVIVGSGASVFVERVYYRARSNTRRSCVFLGNIVLIAILSHVPTAARVLAL